MPTNISFGWKLRLETDGLNGRAFAGGASGLDEMVLPLGSIPSESTFQSLTVCVLIPLLLNSGIDDLELN